MKARYLHSEVDTLERIQIIRELRLGDYDVLVGVNLQGLGLPEVSLVAVLDADKEGFLRGKTALVQTIGRAARNVNEKVLLYADKLTEAIKGAMEETERRRSVQLAYNEEHGITAESIVKGVSDIAEFLSLEQPHVPGRRRRGAAKVEGMDRRRAGTARDHPGRGDVRRGGGAALRVRGQAARRDQGTAPRAERARREPSLGRGEELDPQARDSAEMRVVSRARDDAELEMERRCRDSKIVGGNEGAALAEHREELAPALGDLTSEVDDRYSGDGRSDLRASRGCA